MATKSVSVRIPEEALTELEKMARLKNLKVSDIVRDLILEKLTGGSQADNRLVLEYLEGFGAVLAGIHNEAARSRFYGELMTSYGMDMQNLMVDGKVVEKEVKEELMARFSNASLQVAQESWLAALNYQKPPEGEPG
jgi:hypothetical protein